MTPYEFGCQVKRAVATSSLGAYAGPSAAAAPVPTPMPLTPLAQTPRPAATKPPAQPKPTVPGVRKPLLPVA